MFNKYFFESTDVVPDDAVFRGNLIKRIDDFLGALDVQVGDVNGDGDVENEAAFVVSASTKSYIRSVWISSVETTFNALDDADVELQAIQNYSVGGSSAPLTITADMPEFDTLLNRLDLDGKLRASLPVGFDFAPTATKMSFTITGQTAAATGVGGDEVASVGMTIGGFGLTNNGALFEFGAANALEIDATNAAFTNNVTEYTSTTELPLGFLSANITAISTGQVGLYTDFLDADDIALGREIIFDIAAFQADPTATEADVTGTGDTFTLEMRAQEVGSNIDLVFDLLI